MSRKVRQASQRHKLRQEAESAKLMLRVLLGLLVVFILILVGLAYTSDHDEQSNGGLPTKDEAYQMAKYYIRQDTHGNSIRFPDEGYAFARKSDSVFVVRTDAVLLPGPDGKKVSYTTMLRYTGGPASNEHSWTLLDINHN